MTSNRDKLKTLLLDVFLLEEHEFSFELARADVKTWDSLGLVSLAVGVEETFGHHLSPEEITAVKSVPDLVAALRARGVPFDD